MSELTRSIIRGFGGQIGRNFANSTRRRSTNSVGRPAKSELDKALSYTIGGRVNTMIGKQFTLVQGFENHVSGVDSINDYVTLGLAFNKASEKFNDTCTYINMVGDTPEQHEQSVQMRSMLDNVMKSKLQTIINSLFNSSNLSEIADNTENIENAINAAKQFGIQVDTAQTQKLIKKAKRAKFNKTVLGVAVVLAIIFIPFIVIVGSLK